MAIWTDYFGVIVACIALVLGNLALASVKPHFRGVRGIWHYTGGRLALYNALPSSRLVLALATCLADVALFEERLDTQPTVKLWLTQHHQILMKAYAEQQVEFTALEDRLAEAHGGWPWRFCKEYFRQHRDADIVEFLENRIRCIGYLSAAADRRFGQYVASV